MGSSWNISGESRAAKQTPGWKSPCSEEILRWIELHSSQGILQNAQSVTRNRAVFRGYSRVRWKLHRCGINISTDHSTLKLWLFSVPLRLVKIAVRSVLRGDEPAQSEHPVWYKLAIIINRVLSYLLPTVGVWYNGVFATNLFIFLFRHWSL